MHKRRGTAVAIIFVIIILLVMFHSVFKPNDDSISYEHPRAYHEKIVRGIRGTFKGIMDVACVEIPEMLENTETPENTEMSELTDEYLSSLTKEEKLLAITQHAAGYELETYVYVDMDHDGSDELIGVYCDDIWYCSSDGETCLQVHQNEFIYDENKIELLEFDNETHVVINAYNLMGTNKNYSIIALKDNVVSCLVSNNYGYVYMTEEGDIILDVEAYDAMYDSDSGLMLGHTWNDTYLYYDGETYREYGATEITEEEFLHYENAQLLKDMIASQLTQSDTTKLEYYYFVRKNNILHIQCNVYNEYGSINYGYYTVRLSGNTLDKQFIILDRQFGEYTEGQMAPSFSSLEVTY